MSRKQGGKRPNSAAYTYITLTHSVSIMKLPRIFISGILICLLAFPSTARPEKQKTSTVPSTENQDIEEIKPSTREIDSIKSLKKKKSKRFDTLKPGVAALRRVLIEIGDFSLVLPEPTKPTK